MTNEDIIRMAREAGWEMDNSCVLEPQVVWYISQGQLERFAALVAAAEREAIEQRIHKLDITLHTRLYVINHAIRARGLGNLNKEAEKNGEEL